MGGDFTEIDVASDGAIEDRLRRVEDQLAIRDLVARYGFAVDDRDIEALAACFAPHGAFRSEDGVLNARGREAVLEQFRGRFAVLGPTNHFTHDHVVALDPVDRNRATGRLTAHAEVVRNDRPMVVALRYQDEYVRGGTGWQFADRLLSFFYYLDVRDYARFLPDRLRMRAYAEPQPADWPEGTAAWQAYARGEA